MNNDKMRQLIHSAMEWAYDLGLERQYNESTGDKSLSDKMEEYLSREDVQAALAQQPESEPAWWEVSDWDSKKFAVRDKEQADQLAEYYQWGKATPLFYCAPQPSAQVPEFTDYMAEALEGVLKDHGFDADHVGELDKKACWDAMLSAAPSIAEAPDHTEQPLAMVVEKPQLSLEDLKIIRQWYNCVSDLNPKYLNNDGFDDASVIRKVSALIDDGLQRPQPPEKQ